MTALEENGNSHDFMCDDDIIKRILFIHATGVKSFAPKQGGL